jgi:polyphosphate kinase 2 (PPK2 family)
MNVQCVTVTGFKVPSQEEAAHNFLWRYHKAVPPQGHVAIFYRSHYKEVLIQRVHDMVPEAVWSKRYGQIYDFEQILVGNGIHIFKFYLQIDADQQLERFKPRVQDPTGGQRLRRALHPHAQGEPDLGQALRHCRGTPPGAARVSELVSAEVAEIR